MSHHIILATKCVTDSVLKHFENSCIHTPMTKLISIYQLKKITPVKFEFPYKFDIASPVTLVQK